MAPSGKGSKTAMSFGAFLVSLAATMLATRSFLHDQPIWGAFYLAIAAASLLTVAFIRSG